MQKFYVPSLLELSKEIGRLVRHFQSLKADEPVEVRAQETYKNVMADHCQSFDALGLRMCARHCERIIKSAENETQTTSDLSKMLEELYHRMEDECGLRKFFALSERQADLIEPAAPLFGSEVDKKYPSAAFEIEEAGKCLGLDRSTAAVFHLMRTIEIGIASVAKCLGIPDPIKPSQRNWGAILKTLRAELDRRGSAPLAAWANPNRAFFEEVYVSLDAVRNPWRNTTMHVENRYTTEEAEHIFMAVKAFMRKLASRMDEEGNPLA